MPTATTQHDEHTRLMRALHAAGRDRGFGHATLREIVGVESLSNATEKQLRSALARLNDGRRNPKPNRARSASEGPGSRGFIDGYQRDPRRPNRARSASEGPVIRLPSPKQRSYVNGLLGKLCWTSAQASQYIGGTWRADDDGRLWKDEDRTSTDAAKTINLLLGYVRQQEGRQSPKRQRGSMRL